MSPVGTLIEQGIVSAYAGLAQAGCMVVVGTI